MSSKTTWILFGNNTVRAEPSQGKERGPLVLLVKKTSGESDTRKILTFPLLEPTTWQQMVKSMSMNSFQNQMKQLSLTCQSNPTKYENCLQNNTTILGIKCMQLAWKYSPSRSFIIQVFLHLEIHSGWWYPVGWFLGDFHHMLTTGTKMSRLKMRMCYFQNGNKSNAI